jgi:hypothetical protein
MKKEFKVTKEFVLEAHRSACTQWKEKIEATIPGAFVVERPKGTWMINTMHNNCLVLIPDDFRNEGPDPNALTYAIHRGNKHIDCLNEYKYANTSFRNYRVATNTEIVDRLEEAFFRSIKK